MLVFTPEFVGKIKKRYERDGVYQKPSIYYIVTRDENDFYRNNVERLVGSLSIKEQRNTISRLQSPDSFFQTYHELILRDELTKLGFQVEAVELDGLTPDWLVIETATTPAFLIEVFTANFSEVSEAENIQREDLWGRLKSIRKNADLRVEFYCGQKTLNPSRNKKIITQIKIWLDTSPSVDSVLPFEELSITFLQSTIDGTGIRLIYFTPSEWANIKPVKLTILEKVKKYKSLSNTYNYPLVVACFPIPLSYLDEEDFEDGLFGDKEFKAYLNSEGKVIAGPGWVRKNNGILESAPYLSAALWCWYDGNWQMKIFHNENAEKPLPPSTFEKHLE